MDFLTHHTPHPNAGIAISLCSSLKEENLSQKPQAKFPWAPIGQDWVTWPVLSNHFELLWREMVTVNQEATEGWYWRGHQGSVTYLCVKDVSNVRWVITVGKNKFQKLRGAGTGCESWMPSAWFEENSPIPPGLKIWKSLQKAAEYQVGPVESSVYYSVL